MKIIYSHWKSSDGPFFCNKEMAELSHKSVKKLGYKTCLYTDNIGYDLLSDIGYDEIIMFDTELLKSFNPKIWSLGKILAMSLVREPFIHLDFDFFLFKKLGEKIEEKDFFSLYFETWINITNCSKKVYKKLGSFLDNVNLNNFNSYNFSLVGGKNYKNINDICKYIINFTIQYSEIIANINEPQQEYYCGNWELAVFFEQILIPDLLLNKYKIKISNVFPDFQFSSPARDFKEVRRFLINNFSKYKMLHLHAPQKLEKLNLIKNYLI